jgi:pimeloyl-ACP methyl ester carboxylesterase
MATMKNSEVCFPVVSVVAVPALIAAILVGCAEAPKQNASALVTENYFIPSRDSGIQLYIRNKHLQGMSEFGPERILLYVHGATYPSEATFDLALSGLSWMDYIAQRGYDVYFVDLRGYGGSTRPTEMEQPPMNNPPIVTTDVAVRDVSAAVDYILARRHAAKINLIGWSWGTTIMAAYTAQNNDKVNRLILYAPQWIRSTPSPISEGAYRRVSMGPAKERWLKGAPENKRSDLIPAGWFEALAAALLATDPVGSKENPPTIRAPNGVLQDTNIYWSAGKPYYDPGMITVPILIVHAEWDADLPSYMSQTLFTKLANTPYKRFVEIGEGTHFIFMEKNRMQLFREVQLFLDERALGRDGN